MHNKNFRQIFIIYSTNKNSNTTIKEVFPITYSSPHMCISISTPIGIAQLNFIFIFCLVNQLINTTIKEALPSLWILLLSHVPFNIINTETNCLTKTLRKRDLSSVQPSNQQHYYQIDFD